MNTTKIRLLAALAGASCTMAHAGGIVTSLDETSLRAALVGGGDVTFAVDGTVTLDSTLEITNTTMIDAAGRSVTISGNNSVRIFDIKAGASLTLKQLTLVDGLSQGPDGAVPGTDGQPGQGGAIQMDNGILTATGCSFRNNQAKGGGGYADAFSYNQSGRGAGGAIYALGSDVFVTNCLFSLNSALGGKGLVHSGGGDGGGGAIFFEGGQLHVVGSTFHTNRAHSGNSSFDQSFRPSGRASGGAIEFLDGTGTLAGNSFVGSESRVGYQVNPAQGGAVVQRGGSLWIESSTFVNSTTYGGTNTTFSPGGNSMGGALALLAGFSTVSNCTVAACSASGGPGGGMNSDPGSAFGGGIYASNSLVLVNCTLSGNAALCGNDLAGMQAAALGGGIFCSGATVSIRNVTFAGNGVFPNPFTNQFAIQFAIGGNLSTTNSAVEIQNTILARPLAGSNVFGALNDLGYNIASDGSANLSGPGSLNSSDARLGPLGDYGGPTPTMPLLSGSPAIDAASPVSFPSKDQRGRSRPFGTAADIGAFESSPPYVIQGSVSGATLNDEVTLSASGSETAFTNQGRFALHELAAGTHKVTPSHPSYMFVPAQIPVAVGPDHVGVDFKAYRWNALSLDYMTNQTMHVVVAATNGQAVRLLSSTNLQHWAPIRTNVAGTNQLIEMDLPVGSDPGEFFRSAIP